MISHNDDMEEVLKTWAGLASHLIGDCFDAAKPFIDKDYEGLDPKTRFVSAQLFADCHLTSESVLILVRQRKEWDADFVNRAVLEGSLKYVFMLLGTKPEIAEKVSEYWDVLPLFAAVRRSERLTKFLAAVPNPEAVEWMPYREMILDEVNIETIRSRYGRSQRAALESKWSFSGISQYFLKSSDASARLLGHLAHGYGMSSHLLHKDGDGIGMVWDRHRRDSQRQRAVRLAHAARITSDVATFAKLRLFQLLRTCGAPTDAVSQIETKYQLLTDETAKANSNFTLVEYGKATEAS